MPRESIVIQCGQCGNQIGHKFWDMALREHAAFNQNCSYDSGLSSLFRNVDIRYDLPIQAENQDGLAQIKFLKARAILIDMEEGVVNQLLKGPLSDLFDSKQCITSNSGSGNNWAHGHCYYGPKYQNGIMDKIRHQVERCDSLQSFFLLHSLGGGTGSGTGTFTLQLLYVDVKLIIPIIVKDAYPKVFKFCTSVFPSHNDDVITSPFNSVLAVGKLCEYADSVFPVENQALMDFSKRKRAEEIICTPRLYENKENPFDKMNAIVGHLLLHLTSSLRFEGHLNVDLGEIVTNMVPFPNLHFLPSSMAWQPSYSPIDKAAHDLPSKSIDQSFNEILSSENQLMEINPVKYTYLACALLVRGGLHTNSISDFSHNISRLQKCLNMIHWNQEGFKVGLCNQPPLQMSNNTSIRARFVQMKKNFNMLYKKKFYLHHFEEYMDLGMFSQSIDKLDDLIAKYAELESMKPPATIRRFKPLLHGF